MMENDEAFAQTRLLNKDFGRAGKASTCINRAFSNMTPKHAKDVFSRLSKLCKSIINNDAVNERGSRKLLSGSYQDLTSFEFTDPGIFKYVMGADYTCTVDRAAGTVSVAFPAYAPRDEIKAPENATHYRIKLGAAAIDLETSDHKLSTTDSDEIAKNETTTPAVTLTASIPANTTRPVFIALSIEFLSEEHERLYPVLNSKFNLMKMIAVDVVA